MLFCCVLGSGTLTLTAMLDASGLKFESGKRFLIAISEFYRQLSDNLG